jgi:hypothetical protein
LRSKHKNGDYEWPFLWTTQQIVFSRTQWTEILLYRPVVHHTVRRTVLRMIDAMECVCPRAEPHTDQRLKIIRNVWEWKIWDEGGKYKTKRRTWNSI